MSAEHPTLQTRIKSEAAKAILRVAYNLNVENPSHYLVDINAFLRKSGGNLVLYCNHIAFDDPALALILHARHIDPKGERHLIIPASHWHTDPNHSKPFYTATQAAKFFFGAEIFRLIQSYMVNNPEFGSYTPDDARKNYSSFFRRLKDLQINKTRTTLLIYPEGHRSESGELQSVEEGFTAAARFMSPVVYVPLATYYEDTYSRSSLNVRSTGHHANIAVGTPYYLLDKQQKPPADLLMRNLAQSLPGHMRGSYV